MKRDSTKVRFLFSLFCCLYLVLCFIICCHFPPYPLPLPYTYHVSLPPIYMAHNISHHTSQLPSRTGNKPRVRISQENRKSLFSIYSVEEEYGSLYLCWHSPAIVVKLTASISSLSPSRSVFLRYTAEEESGSGGTVAGSGSGMSSGTNKRPLDLIDLCVRKNFIFGLCEGGMVTIWNNHGALVHRFDMNRLATHAVQNMRTGQASTVEVPKFHFQRVSVSPDMSQFSVASSSGAVFLVRLRVNLPAIMSDRNVDVEARTVHISRQIKSKQYKDHSTYDVESVAKSIQEQSSDPLHRDPDDLIDDLLFNNQVSGRTLRSRKRRPRNRLGAARNSAWLPPSSSSSVSGVSQNGADNPLDAAVMVDAGQGRLEQRTAPGLEVASGFEAVSVALITASTSFDVPLRDVFFSHFSLVFTHAVDEKQQQRKSMLHALGVDASNETVHQDHVYIVSRLPSGEHRIITHDFKSQFHPLCSNSTHHIHHSPHFFTPSGIYILIPTQTQDQIIRNILVFSLRSGIKRSSNMNLGPLCAANGWDLHSARVSALKIGLKFREPYVIQQSLMELHSTDPMYPSTEEQELLGCQLLMNHIEKEISLSETLARQMKEADANANAAMASANNKLQYFSALLQIGVEFTSSLIKEHTRDLLQHEGTGVEEQKMESEALAITDAVFRRLKDRTTVSLQHAPTSQSHLVDVILQLSAYLDKLRHLQSDVLVQLNKPIDDEIEKEMHRRQDLILDLFGEKDASTPTTSPINVPASTPKKKPPVLPRAVLESPEEAKEKQVQQQAQQQQQQQQKQQNPQHLTAESQKAAFMTEAELDDLLKSVLSDGRISQVLAAIRPHLLYLYEKEKQRVTSAKKKAKLKQKDQLVLTRISPMQFLRQHVGRLVYRLLCNDQMSYLTMSARLLRLYGENETAYFRHVAFNTCRRSLRAKLLRHLSHTCTAEGEPALSEYEIELARFLQLLESLCPNPCYNSARNRRFAKQQAAISFSDVSNQFVSEGTPLDLELEGWERFEDAPHTQITSSTQADHDGNKPTTAQSSSSATTTAGALAASLTSPSKVRLGGVSRVESTELLSRGAVPLLGWGSRGYGTDSSDDENDPYADSSEDEASPVEDRKVDPSSMLLDPSVDRDRFVSIGEAITRSSVFGMLNHSLDHPSEKHLWATGDIDDLRMSRKELISFRVNENDSSNLNIPHHHPHSSSSDQAGGTVEDQDSKMPDACLSCLDSFEKEALFVTVPGSECYLHTTMAWLSKWSRNVKYRVMLEINDMTHLHERLSGKNTDPQLQRLLEAYPEMVDLSHFRREDEVEFVKAQLGYALSHNNLEGLLLWVDRLPLEGGYAATTGQLKVRAGVNNPVLKDLMSVIESQLYNATAFMKEVLVDELARRGIFVESVLGLPSSKDGSMSTRGVHGPPPTSGSGPLLDFSGLLLRLAKLGLLLRVPDDAVDQEPTPVSASVDLKRVLPFNQQSPFHFFAMAYFVFHDLPKMLHLYVEHYQLPLSQISTCNSLFQSMMALMKMKLGTSENKVLNKTFSPWFDVDLHVRQGSLYKASLRNASISTKGGRPETTSTIQSLFSKRHELIALGTLMYSPSGLIQSGNQGTHQLTSGSLVLSVHAPRGHTQTHPYLEPHVVHLRVSQSYLAPFRELRFACFPPNPAYFPPNEKKEVAHHSGSEVVRGNSRPSSTNNTPIVGGVSKVSPNPKPSSPRLTESKKAELARRAKMLAGNFDSSDSSDSEDDGSDDESKKESKQTSTTTKDGSGFPSDFVLEKAALPPQEPEVISPAHALGRDELLNGNIHTWQADLSLFDLLEDVSFSSAQWFSTIKGSATIEEIDPDTGLPIATAQANKEGKGANREAEGGSVRVEVKQCLANPDYSFSEMNEEWLQTLMAVQDRELTPFCRDVPYVYFSHPLVSKRAPVSKLTFDYYLTKGRTLEAFMALFTQIQEEMANAEKEALLLGGGGVTSSVSVRQGEEARKLVATPAFVRRSTLEIGLRHLLEPAVERSCLTFLQLCAIDTIPFRSVMEAAKRVFNFLRYLSTQKDIPEDPSVTFDSVLSLFIPLCQYAYTDVSEDGNGNVEVAYPYELVQKPSQALLQATLFLTDLQKRAQKEQAASEKDKKGRKSKSKSKGKGKKSIGKKSTSNSDDSSFSTHIDMDVYLSRQLLGRFVDTSEGDFVDGEDLLTDVGKRFYVALPTPFLSKEVMWHLHDDEDDEEEDDEEVEEEKDEEKKTQSRKSVLEDLKKGTLEIEPSHLLLQFQLQFHQPLSEMSLKTLVQDVSLEGSSEWHRLLYRLERFRVPPHEAVRLVSDLAPDSAEKHALLAFLTNRLLSYKPYFTWEAPSLRDSATTTAVGTSEGNASRHLMKYLDAFKGCSDVDILSIAFLQHLAPSKGQVPSRVAAQRILDVAVEMKKPLLCVLCASFLPHVQEEEEKAGFSIPPVSTVPPPSTTSTSSTTSSVPLSKGSSTPPSLYDQCMNTWMEVSLNEAIAESGTGRTHPIESRSRTLSYPQCVEYYLRECHLNPLLLEIVSTGLSIFHPEPVKELHFPSNAVTVNPLLSLVQFSTHLLCRRYDHAEKCLTAFVSCVDDGIRQVMSRPTPNLRAVAFLESTVGCAASHIERLLLVLIPNAGSDGAHNNNSNSQRPPISYAEDETDDETDDASSVRSMRGGDSSGQNQGQGLLGKKDSHSTGFSLIRILDMLMRVKFFSLNGTLSLAGADVDADNAPVDEEESERFGKRTGASAASARAHILKRSASLRAQFVSSWMSCIETSRSALDRILQMDVTSLSPSPSSASSNSDRSPEFNLPYNLALLGETLKEESRILSHTPNAAGLQVVKELRVTHNEMKTSFLWQFEEERLQFWEECCEELRSRSVPNDIVRSFFADIVREHSSILTPEEREVLFGIVPEGLIPAKPASESQVETRDTGVIPAARRRGRPLSISLNASSSSASSSAALGMGGSTSRAPYKLDEETETAIVELLLTSVPHVPDQVVIETPIAIVDGGASSSSANGGAARSGTNNKGDMSSRSNATDATGADEFDLQKRVEETVTALVGHMTTTVATSVPSSKVGGASSSAALDSGVPEPDLCVADVIVDLYLKQGLRAAHDFVTRFRLNHYGYMSLELALLQLASMVTGTPVNKSLSYKVPPIMEPVIQQFFLLWSSKMRSQIVSLDMVDRSALLEFLTSCAVANDCRITLAEMHVKYDVARFLHLQYSKVEESAPLTILTLLLKEEKQRQRAAYHRRQAELRLEIVKNKHLQARGAKAPQVERKTEPDLPEKVKMQETVAGLHNHIVASDNDPLCAFFERPSSPVVFTGREKVFVLFRHYADILIESDSHTFYMGASAEDVVSVIAEVFFHNYCEGDSAQTPRIPAPCDAQWLSSFAFVPVPGISSESDLLRDSPNEFMAALSRAFLRLSSSERVAARRTTFSSSLSGDNNNFGDDLDSSAPSSSSASSSVINGLRPMSVPLSSVPFIVQANALVLAYHCALKTHSIHLLEEVASHICTRIAIYVNHALKDRSRSSSKTKALSPGFEALCRLFTCVIVGEKSCAFALFDATIGPSSPSALVPRYSGAMVSDSATSISPSPSPLPDIQSPPSWSLLMKLMQSSGKATRAAVSDMLEEYLCRPECRRWNENEFQHCGFFFRSHHALGIHALHHALISLPLTRDEILSAIDATATATATLNRKEEKTADVAEEEEEEKTVTSPLSSAVTDLGVEWSVTQQLCARIQSEPSLSSLLADRSYSEIVAYGQRFMAAVRHFEAAGSTEHIRSCLEIAVFLRDECEGVGRNDDAEDDDVDDE